MAVLSKKYFHLLWPTHPSHPEKFGHCWDRAALSTSACRLASNQPHSTAIKPNLKSTCTAQVWYRNSARKGTLVFTPAQAFPHRKKFRKQQSSEAKIVVRNLLAEIIGERGRVCVQEKARLLQGSGKSLEWLLEIY